MDVSASTHDRAPGTPRFRVLDGAHGEDADGGLVTGPESDLVQLRDAATLLVALRRLDGLILALVAHPFDEAAYSGLASYLTGPGRRALQAFDRATAANSPLRGL